MVHLNYHISGHSSVDWEVEKLLCFGGVEMLRLDQVKTGGFDNLALAKERGQARVVEGLTVSRESALN